MNKYLAVVAAPASTTVTSAIAVMTATNDSALAISASCVAGIVTLGSVLAVLAKDPLQTLIRHWAEIIRARTERDEISRISKAAVTGPARKAEDAAAKRADALQYAQSRDWSGLDEAMKTTRPFSRRKK